MAPQLVFNWAHRRHDLSVYLCYFMRLDYVDALDFHPSACLRAAGQARRTPTLLDGTVYNSLLIRIAVANYLPVSSFSQAGGAREKLPLALSPMESDHAPLAWSRDQPDIGWCTPSGLAVTAHEHPAAYLSALA